MKRPSQKTKTAKTWLDDYSALAEKGGKIAAVVAGADFLLGYISIIVTAFRNKLGFIPPVQPQCLLAGAIPTIVVAVTIVVSVSWQRVSERIATWIERPKARSSQTIRYLLFGFSPYVLLYAIGHIKIITGIVALITFDVVMYLIPISMVTGFVLRMRRDKKRYGIEKPIQDLSQLALLDEKAKSGHDYISRVEQHVAKHSQRQKIISLLWFVPTAAVVWPGVFQALPQEFGGMRPRYAFVDVKKDSLSPETRKLLLPNPTAPDAVARSLPLAVYYENDGTLFVRRATDSTQTPVQEIKKDAIEGVTWRGYDPPPKK